MQARQGAGLGQMRKRFGHHDRGERLVAARTCTHPGGSQGGMEVTAPQSLDGRARRRPPEHGEEDQGAGGGPL